MFQQRAERRDHRGLYDRRTDLAFIDIAQKTGRGLAVTAAVLAAVSLTTAPGTAYAERGDHEGGGRHGGGNHEDGGQEGGDWHGGGHWRGEGWGGGRPYYYRYSHPYYGYSPYYGSYYYPY
jgi:hypothetical protein